MLAVIAAIGFVHQPLALAFSTDVLSGGDSTLGVTRFGLIQAVVGTGALLGVLGVSSLGPRRPAVVLLGTGAVMSLSLIGLGLTSSLAVALAVSGTLGAAQFANLNLTQVLVQHHAPDHLRGQVLALTQVCAGGLFPFTSYGLALLADTIGIPHTYVLAGAVCLATVLLTVPSRRDLRLPVPGTPWAGGAVAPAEAAVVDPLLPEQPAGSVR